jgi:RHS repeat-associated protein
MRLYDEDTDGIYGENNDGEQYFLHDANFNVTAVIDETGTVLERYYYTPYGEVTFLEPDFDAISDSAIGNTHLYTGRERDPETGLQLNRHRYYHPTLGRWLTRDPIKYEGGPNLYGYVNGQPTAFVDPSGEVFWLVVIPVIIITPLVWPDPANAPAPGDSTYPATGHGFGAGICIGVLGGCAIRCAPAAIGKICTPKRRPPTPPSTARRCPIEALEQPGVPGTGGPVTNPGGGNVPRPIQSQPPADPWVQVGPPVAGG